MENTSSTSYRDLSRQAVAIIALAAFTWGMASGMNLIDAAFRGVVVYFTASLLAMGLKGILLRVTDIPALSTGDNIADEAAPTPDKNAKQTSGSSR